MKYSKKNFNNSTKNYRCNVTQSSLFSTALCPTVTGIVDLQLLNYGNTILARIPSHLIKQMQSVMIPAAQLVYSTSRYDCITRLLT